MKNKSRFACFVLIAATYSAVQALATDIPPGLDIDSVRSGLQNQGYLSFHRSFEPLGEERTGWTDVRHPAYFAGGVAVPNMLVKDNRIGYDRSDKSISVQNVIVRDKRGVDTNPNIARDYNFANAAYSQIGISVINAGNVVGVYNNVDFAIDGPANVATSEDVLIRAANRAADPIVNNYYIQSFSDGTRGWGPGPQFVAPQAAVNGGQGWAGRSGIVVSDAANSVNDTFAHELGHFVIDDHGFNGGDRFHSTANTELMASGGLPRLIPALTPKSPINDAPKQVGRPIGALGGRSRFDVNSVCKWTINAGAGACNPAPFNINQPNSIYAPEFNGVSYVQVTHNLSAGDRADFDWVEDNTILEQFGNVPNTDPAYGRTDNHPGPGDFMVWEIGATAASNQAGHDHGAWGTLNLPDFAGQTFRVVDVVSQIARFADMDVDGTGEWSERESALDYTLDCSANGVNWAAGAVQLVFKRGWTEASDAENFLARWDCSVDARFVRIKGNAFPGHDQNVQIDALIVPEPATVGFISLCLLSLRRRSAGEKRLPVCP
jgi:hypothetical protein